MATSMDPFASLPSGGRCGNVHAMRRPGRPFPFFPPLLAVVAIALFFPWMANAGPRPLPPGLEPQVQALVNGASAKLPAGWSTTSIAIGPHGFDVGVAGPAGAKVELGLRAADDETRGTRVGESKSFSVWLRAGSDEAVVQSFVTGLGGVDDGTFWGVSAQVEPPPTRAEPKENKPAPDPVPMARPLGFFDDARRLLLWLSMLAALLVGVRSASRTSIAVVAGVFVVAAVVRFGFVAPGPIHSNDHGFAELRGLVGPPLDAQVPVETDRYGVAYGQVVRRVSWLFGGGADGVLRTGAFFSSSAAAAVAAASMVLVGSPAAGVVAGLALALHPGAAVLGPTESAFSLAALLLALALAAIAMLFDESTKVRWPWAVVAAAATSCGLELGVTTVAIPGAVFVVGLALARWPHLVRFDAWRGFFAGFAVVAITLVSHLLSLSELLKFASTTRTTDVAEIPRRLTSLGWTHGGEAVAVLAVVGLVVALVTGRWRLFVAFPVGAAALLATGLIISACETDRLRYLALAWVLLAIASGFVASFGRPLLSGAIAVVSVVALVVTSAPALRPLSDPSARIDAWTWSIVRNFPWDVNDRVVVRLPPRRMDKVLADFPDDAVSPRVKSLTLVEGDVAMSEESRCLVWIPPACWRFTKEEVAANAHVDPSSPVPGLREGCRAVWSLASEPPPLVPAWPGAIADDFHVVPLASSARVGLVACRGEKALQNP